MLSDSRNMKHTALASGRSDCSLIVTSQLTSRDTSRCERYPGHSDLKRQCCYFCDAAENDVTSQDDSTHTAMLHYSDGQINLLHTLQYCIILVT